MNHNVLEMYKQAITFAYGTVEKEHWDSSVFQGVIAGKYAELIVRECTERLLNDVKLTDIRTSRCVASINEHFGVEE